MLKQLRPLIRRLRAQGTARRLASGTFANLVGKIWVLLVQLVAIPILTKKWGVRGYGVWLMISTIPTYVALSDFGLGTAAGVDITARIAIGDRQGALQSFQSVWSFLTAIVLAIAAAVGVYATILFLLARPDADPFEGRSLAGAVFFMTLYSVLAAQMSIVNVVFRATHKYALGALMSDGLLLVEGIGVAVVSLKGGRILAGAVTWFSIRLTGAIAYYAILRHLEPWVSIGWAHATLDVVKRLARPSIAALSLTLSNALALQGVILTLGWTAGPAVVAVFGAARFLTRIPLQFSGLVMRASIPELTRAVVNLNARIVKRLLMINVLTSVIATIPFAFVLFVFGPQLLSMMSGNRLVARSLLFVLLGTAAAANAMWMALSSPLVATNRQAEYSYWYLILSAVTAVAPLLAWTNQSIFVAGAMLLSEAVMIAIVLRLELQEIGAERLSNHEKVG
jgi:O-antigen/teichoic acid export membrane protein